MGNYHQSRLNKNGVKNKNGFEKFSTRRILGGIQLYSSGGSLKTACRLIFSERNVLRWYFSYG